ncbi:MAG TPA: hypothetical protein VIL46_04810, partial [Gemmataceae bacterium]
MTLVRYLGAATALLALAACGRMVAAQAPDDGAELAKKLAQRVTIDKEMKDISFAEAVDYFRAKFELPILIDPLWQQQKVGGQPPLMKRTEEVPGALADRLAVSLRQVAVGDIASPVTIPAIKNVKLETLLRHVLDQVGATFLVMPDHLKITGHDFAVYESGQRGTEGSGDPLVEPEL